MKAVSHVRSSGKQVSATWTLFIIVFNFLIAICCCTIVDTSINCDSKIPISVGSTNTFQDIVQINLLNSKMIFSEQELSRVGDCFSKNGFNVISVTRNNIYLNVGHEEYKQLTDYYKENCKLVFSKSNSRSMSVLSDNDLDQADIMKESTINLAKLDPQVKNDILKVYSGFDRVPEGYPNLNQVNNYLNDLEKRYPGKVKKIQITNKPTFENRHIFGVKISKHVEKNRDVPNILIVSAHHSREISTVITNIVMIEKLLSDPKWEHLLNFNQFYFIPIVNVDGYDYVFTRNNFWRKNRNIAGIINGTNVYGIDLNRNYDLGFDNCAGNATPNTDTYKGKYPFSEVETSAIRDFTRRIGGVVKVLDFHTSGRQVLVGYTCTNNAQQDYIKSLGQELARVAGYSTRVPTSDGEHQEYHIREHTSYSFLVEILKSHQPPLNETISEAVQLVSLFETFANKPIPLRGHVYNEKGTPIENAFIEVSDIVWKAGESRKTNQFGSYYLFLALNQTYELTIRAKGYHTLKSHISLTEETNTKDFVLKSL